MKRANIFYIFSLLLLVACAPSPKEEALKKIIALDKNDSTYDNPNQVAELNNLYKKFIQDYPDDPNCRDFIFKSAEASNMLGQFDEAIHLYEIFYKHYPDDKRARHSLFMQAFIAENGKQQLGKAKDLYTEVIRKYPNTEVARDAAASLNLLGKSDEELIRFLEEKNSRNDSLQ